MSSANEFLFKFLFMSGLGSLVISFFLAREVVKLKKKVYKNE